MSCISLRRFAVVSALFVLVAACATTSSIDQSLGKLAGEMQFTNTTPALTAYLTANPPVVFSTGMRVYPAGLGSTAAIGPYQPLNVAASASVWRVASYEIYPPVDPAGTAFLVVGSVTLGSGGHYRFGNSLQGSPAAHQSALVPPLSSTPAGTTFDVVECAALPNVVLRMTATSTDPNALTALDATTPVSCTVDALVEESPGSGTFNFQARSVPSLPGLAALSGSAGATVSFPVRADGTRAKFRGTCSTVPPAGSNFQVDDAGLASFSGESAVVTLACGASGGPGSGIDINIPVARSAGNLGGRFDIGGYTESSAQVWATPDGSTSRRNAIPAPVPSNQPNPASWQIDNIAAGAVVISAGATIAGGNLAIQLPQTDSPNPKPSVPVNGNLDMGATFVVRPVETGGKLYLLDPGLATRLGMLSNSAAVHWTNVGTSYMEATGDNDSTSDAPPGSSRGGISRGRLQGSFSSTAGCLSVALGCADLSYRMLFSGLSPINGALDGSESRRTPWEVNSARLEFRGTAPYHLQYTTLFFSRDLRYYSDASVPAELPSLGACMGQVELDMRVDASTGTLYNPSFTSINANVTATPTALGVVSDILKSNTNAWGTPQTASSAAPAASVAATVPEGARYELRPGAQFLPAAGGPSTSLTGLPWITLPGGGRTLACSEKARACIKINDPGGGATPLSVSAGPLDACSTTTNNQVPVSVSSGGTPVQSISWSLDGGAAGSGTYCTNCGVDPSGSITLPPLPDGVHWLKVTVDSQNGCSAEELVAVCGVPVPVEYKKHLAFFDGNVLNMYRLTDGVLQYQVTSAGGAGPITFNRDGSKLAVRAPNQVTILNASAGTSEATVPGTFTDFEFRRAYPNDWAAVLYLVDTGPYLLNTVLGGMPSTPQVIPGSTASTGQTISRPYLTWSNNGQRLFVGFTKTSSTDNKLVVVEWPVSGNVLGAPVSNEAALAAGVQLRALGFEQIGSRVVVGTTQGITVLNPGGVLLSWHNFPTNRVDLDRNPTFAVDPLLAASPQPVSTSVFILHPGGVVQEPAYGTVFGLAISRFAVDPATDQILAVARSTPAQAPGQPAFVNVYRLGLQGSRLALILDRQFAAQNPRFPAFRPWP